MHWCGTLGLTTGNNSNNNWRPIGVAVASWEPQRATAVCLRCQHPSNLTILPTGGEATGSVRQQQVPHLYQSAQQSIVPSDCKPSCPGCWCCGSCFLGKPSCFPAAPERMPTNDFSGEWAQPIQRCTWRTVPPGQPDAFLHRLRQSPQKLIARHALQEPRETTGLNRERRNLRDNLWKAFRDPSLLGGFFVCRTIL
jgi:hypothetical protein